MSRTIRLLAAAALAATGLVGIAATPSLADRPVIDCPSNGDDPGAPIGDPINTPEVIVEDLPVVGDEGVSEGNTCAELVRTLVFVGHAEIDNGVNAAGVGGTVSIQGGTVDCAFNENGSANTSWKLDGAYHTHPTPHTGSHAAHVGTAQPTKFNEYGQPVGPGCDEGNNGGNFQFSGDCVLVNWDNPDASGVTGTPADCDFNPTTGFYTRPNFHGSDSGGTGGLFGCIEDGPGGPDSHPQCQGSGTPGDTGLAWVPHDQASCTESDGKGTSTFTSGLGGADKWSSKYTWNDGLSNLRGTIWKGLPADQSSATKYIFDAKVQTQADPRGVNVTQEPLDVAAAGCLEKTVAALNPLASSNSRTGLNSVLVVGTASWRVENAPELR